MFLENLTRKKEKNRVGGLGIYENKENNKNNYYRNLEFLSKDVHIKKMNKQLINYKQIF